MRGIFITFEGIDGCGKTTQAIGLKKRLETNGHEVIFVREPGGTKISEMIREILLSAENVEMGRVTESILLAASRSQLTKEIIMPALDEGKVVICDRYFDSTIAYQGYGRGLDITWLRELNRVATYELVPHLTFLIDLSVEKCRERMYGKKFDRLEQEDDIFLRKIREGYLSLSKEEIGRYIVVEGDKSIAKIEDIIWKETQKRLKEFY
ncbi:MAG: dTMP kinase [Candidatus Marinimicrobia bacterium]|nr:dTMP kinase [Candidatus Neomarinimicrobiota bacterium]